MKFKILILFSAITLFSCAPVVQKTEPVITIQNDEELVLCDSLSADKDIQIASLQKSLKFVLEKNDSLQGDLFLLNFRIEKIRRYLNICMKQTAQKDYLKYYLVSSLSMSDQALIHEYIKAHPEDKSSQDVFLKGWIRRVTNE